MRNSKQAKRSNRLRAAAHLKCCALSAEMWFVRSESVANDPRDGGQAPRREFKDVRAELRNPGRERTCRMRGSGQPFFLEQKLAGSRTHMRSEPIAFPL